MYTWLLTIDPLTYYKAQGYKNSYVYAMVVGFDLIWNQVLLLFRGIHQNNGVRFPSRLKSDIASHQIILFCLPSYLDIFNIWGQAYMIVPAILRG